VGDCLQGHTYTFAGGTFDEVVTDCVGPGPSTATRVFSHGNEQVIGGGMLADDFVQIPVMFYLMGLAPDVDRNDPDIRRIMAQNYLRTGQVMGPVQEVPTRRARVRLARSVMDASGVRVARLEGEQHPEDLRTAAFMADRAEEWIRAPVRFTAPSGNRQNVRPTRSWSDRPVRSGMGERTDHRGGQQRSRNEWRRKPRAYDHGSGLEDS
jgi:hypothetical protein